MMQPGAASLLGRKDRHIRRGYVRMGDSISRHRVMSSLEEALRLVNLYGEDEGRLYFFRRLAVGTIPVEASRTIWIERVQESLAVQARRAVHGSDLRSANSDAVFFYNDDEALEVILRCALTPGARPAWFWPTAVGLASESQGSFSVAAALERIRDQRSPQHAAAIILAVLDGLVSSNPVPLFSSLPASVLHDWLRSLEASGSTVAEVHPLRLSERVTAMLRVTAQQFGWSDHRTVWLAVQVALSVAPLSQSAAVSVKIARTTLRHLESSQPQHFSTPVARGAGEISRHLVFDEDSIASMLQAQVPQDFSEAHASPTVVHDELPRTMLRGEQTRFAGLYFLLHVLRRLGIAQVLEVCPALVDAGFVARILRALAVHASVSDDDAILCAVQVPMVQETSSVPTSEVLPSGFSAAVPTHVDIDLLVRLWAIAVRRWCWRMGAISTRVIIQRSGRVWCTRTDLDVTFVLADADIRIRRLGLDIDPGWVPWLEPFGLVVRFHYRDRLRDAGGGDC